MNIAIFDTEHFETAHPLIRLFDIPGNAVTIYTDQKTSGLLCELLGEKSSKYKWVIQGNKETNRAFIVRINKLLKISRPELFFYSTISNNFLLHALLLKRHRLMRTVLTLHAINCMFDFHFRMSIRSFVRNIGRKMLMKEVQELNVLSDTMIPWLRHKLKSHKIIHNVPGTIFEPDNTRKEVTNSIKIVIPGSIDKERRDYKQVFELLDLAEEKKLPVKAVLLGAPYQEYGKEIIKLAKNKIGMYSSINVYDTEFIPAAEFDHQLREAHFVFIPSIIKTVAYDGIEEICGVTKTTGNIFDTIKYAKPFLYPKQLMVPKNIEDSGYRYDNIPHLLEFLGSIYAFPQEYNKWNNKAAESSLHYSIDILRLKNPSLFNA